MGDDSQIADYFVVAGLPDNPEPLGDFSDQSHLKDSHSLAPITDITVIFPGFGEECPAGYAWLQDTPTGHPADLNHGSYHSPEVYICYRRGRDKAPLVDIGVLYENKERIMPDSKAVYKTPYQRLANVNNTATKTFLTYRRAQPNMPVNELVVTDICVIIASKGETAPHAFCMIKKNLNKGVFGSEVYLCYKKSMNRSNLVSYTPGILCRYPKTDRADWGLPSNVHMFCLPMGVSLELWPREASQPHPVVSTFVLTVADAAEKVYGSAITFYESYPADNLTKEQFVALEKSLERSKDCEGGMETPEKCALAEEKEEEGVEEEESWRRRLEVLLMTHTVNVNKSICLLSHWPFFETCHKFLRFLYELSLSGPQTVPVERYISHFMENVPFPSPSRPRILVQLSNKERVVLSQPEDIPLPRSGAGFRELLKNLGPEDSLLVLLLILTENKILVHSLRPDVLTAVVEAMSMIIFPFKWQCPYVPLCPLSLAVVLHAPVPFLIGVDSRFFDLYSPPSDVTCVDLDTNNITISEEKRNLTIKLLPKRPARQLRNTLEYLSQKCMESQSIVQDPRLEEDDMLWFQVKDRELRLQLEIQEAFLKFMAIILKGYRTFLLPITSAPTVGTTDPSSLFDLQEFIKSRDRANHKFFNMLMKTQMFIRFIEERSFVSDMDAGLAFFDECTEKVDYEERLLELDELHKGDRTVFIPPPEPPPGLQAGATVEYNGFNLDPNLFRHKDTKCTLTVTTQDIAPGSPMARRTKQEVKSAQKLARRKHSQSAQHWARYLLGTCYSLWFIHLPSYVDSDPTKTAYCLRTAYDLLVKIQTLKLHLTDEVCYRVMMQLCGIHSQPTLAVKLLFQMKRNGIQPNALTYGYYNRAVLEATWPSDDSKPSHMLWNKLRNVIVGAALFRRGVLKGSREKLPEAVSCSSLASLDKVDKGLDRLELDKLERQRSRLGSIVKAHPKNWLQLASYQPIESSAGILMTGNRRSPLSLTRRRNSCVDFSSRRQQTAPEMSAVRLRRGSMSPTIPEGNHLRSFMRSDSFGHDTSILEKHNRAIPTGMAAIKALCVPRESSESLDNTEDMSLDDGESERQDTPTRKIFNKLANVWNSSGWRTSQDSVDASEGTPVTPATPVKGSRRNGKPPWQSSERLPLEEGRELGQGCLGQRSASESREDFAKSKTDSHSSPSVDPRKLSAFSSSNEAAVEPKILNQNDLLLPESRSSSTSGRLSAELFRARVSNNLCHRESIQDSSEDPLNLSHSSSQAELSYDDSELAINGGLSPPGSLSGDPPSPRLLSPVRTPVTENDPLGALLQEQDDVINENELTITPVDARNMRNALADELDRTKYDMSASGLFHTRRTNPDDQGKTDSKGVPKSATFHHAKDKDRTRMSVKPQDQDSDSGSRKAMQRSTTMPDTTSPSVVSGFSHLSSGFKLFSRYSPSRFSLKKTDLHIAKSQLLENAISGSKKSNEILLSGLNSFKSAATSVAKKIEEAISTNSTPVKSFNQTNECEEDDADPTVEKSSALDFEYWGNLKDFFGDGSRKGSSANLHPPVEREEVVNEEEIMKTLYGKSFCCRNADGPVALNIVLTTCCRCNNCSSVLHDEEIIAGWTPEDSNLNTKCHFCGKPTLPLLSVTMYDYRARDKEAKTSSDLCSIPLSFLNRHLANSNLSVNTGSIPDLKLKSGEDDVEGSDVLDSSSKSSTLKTVKSDDSFEPILLEPVTVPYLNPLVLRKELENILHHEGDPSLTKPSFVDLHPIIYWNMMWMFERINVTSHLPGLALLSSVVNKDATSVHSSWEKPGACDQTNVNIRCLWDNPRLHEEVGLPMYVLWQQQDQPSALVSALVTERTTLKRSVIDHVIASLRRDNLHDPMIKLLNERKKLLKKGVSHNYSLYRDILYLAITAFDRSSIDQDNFDKEYKVTYEKLKAEGKPLERCDKPPCT